MPVVVVFPLVPVMPIVLSLSAGWPNHAAERNASAYRASFTRITAVSSGAPALIILPEHGKIARKMN